MEFSAEGVYEGVCVEERRSSKNEHREKLSSDGGQMTAQANAMGELWSWKFPSE